MCGRCVVNISPDELRAIFNLIERPKIEPRYNVAPMQQVGVIRCCDDSNHNRYDLLKWGLVPSWSKDPAAGSHMINARCETVAEKPAFRHAIKYSRCIVPVSGFYEWEHDGKEKLPYYFHMADFSPMCLAGIWEFWKSHDGYSLETFSILTTSSNDLIAPLHNRMPVILQPDDHDLWLNRNMHDPRELVRVYQPAASELIVSHKVSNLINNTRFDSPACIAKC